MRKLLIGLGSLVVLGTLAIGGLSLTVEMFQRVYRSGYDVGYRAGWDSRRGRGHTSAGFERANYGKK